MPEKFFRLVTLGRLALCPPVGKPDPGLHDLNARRRKVALLAVLALRQRSVSRDTLIEMFWGEQDEARARHSLSDAISHLRRVLGRGAIIATRSEVGLAADTPIIVDATEFAEAAGDSTERLRAIELYGGRFLEGVHVDGSHSFESWRSREAARLERMFVKACELECERLSRSGPSDDWIAVAERWLDVEPTSTNAALALLDAISAPATAESDARLLAAYERLRVRLAREYDVAPADAVTERARQAAECAGSRAPTIVPTSLMEPAPVAIPAPVAAIDAPHAAVERHQGFSWRRRVSAGVAAMFVLVAVSAALDARRAGGAATPPARTALAIVEMALADSDTATEWLVDGLPQMIAAKLSRVSAVDVVPPAEIRALRRRGEMDSAATSPSALRDLGRRAGATLVVSGTFMRRGSMNLLELRLLDVRAGRTVQVEAVADSSVLTLVDRAVVRLLDAVGANSGDGPRLAEVETANLEAYQHFVRSYQLGYDHPAEAVAELDAAIALDSGFTSAVVARVTQSIADNDAALTSRLAALLQKFDARISPRDRLEWESRLTLMSGDIERSESLARLLVQRYPRDPRGYQMLSTVYGIVGRWAEQENVLERLLALDSLGMEAGRGPCVSCFGFGNLTSVRMFRGDWVGAERAARRWTALTPEMHAAWTNLALTQAYHGRFTDARASAQRAIALAPDEPSVSLTWAYVSLMSRDFDAAEVAIAAWEKSGTPRLRRQALDVRAVLQRERGQFRAANATIQRSIAEFPELAMLDLVRADGLARLGDCRAATATIESIHGPRQMTADPAPGGPSRGFAWHHALLADAMARSANCPSSPRLDALADSIDRIARRSYYGRDWSLHHHVRGLIARQKGDYALAEEELRRAQWRVADGWTRSMAELATVQLERGRAADAIETLRNAYATRPDAMGRYEPRSNLDYIMALAFRRAGLPDSAAVYEAHVRRAWVNADPEVKALLRRLD